MPIRVASHIYRNRHDTFYFRFVIPAELRPTARRRELSVSLQTEQRHLAMDFALPIIAALTLLAADLRRMASENERPTEDYFAKWREQMFVNAALRVQIRFLKEELSEQQELMSGIVTQERARKAATWITRRALITRNSTCTTDTALSS